MAFLVVESPANSSASVVESAVKALKLLFFSAGLISTLLMVKGALAPFLYEIFLPNLVAFWSSFRCFLSSPLYICIIINSVVLLIAATSSFHYHDPTPGWDATVLEAASPSTSDVDDCNDAPFSHDCSLEKEGVSPENTVPEPEGHEDEDEKESERNETLESTWRAIVDDKTKKKLTKSESVHAPPRSSAEYLHSASATATWKELRKLETFNERVSVRRLGGLRRDPSIGIDEFNQQVEAFINKFNQDMRLQRQESHQRFLDMIQRGL